MTDGGGPKKQIKTMKSKSIKDTAIDRAFSVMNDGDELIMPDHLQFFSGPGAGSFLCATHHNHAVLVIPSRTAKGRATQKRNADFLLELFGEAHTKIGYLPVEMTLYENDDFDYLDVVRIGRNYYRCKALQAVIIAGRMLGVTTWEVRQNDKSMVLNADGAEALIMALNISALKGKRPDFCKGIIEPAKDGEKSKVDFYAGFAYCDKYDQRQEQKRQEIAEKRKGHVWAVKVLQWSTIYVEANDEDEAREFAGDHLDDAELNCSGWEIAEDDYPEELNEDEMPNRYTIHGHDGESWNQENYPNWPD